MPLQGSAIVEPVQFRMARAALGWSVTQLAEYAGLSEKTVRRIEDLRAAHPSMTVQTYKSLVRCFEESGIVFLPADGSALGAGVRVKS